MRTVAALWANAVGEPRPSPAFLVEERAGWREVGWTEAGRRVEELAAGFVELGLTRGDRVALLARSRLEWTLSDFALASIGAVVVPVYATSTARECAYVLEHSGARALVCEDEEQLSKVAPHRAGLERLEHLLAIEPAGDLPTLEDVAERGRELLARHPTVVAEARAALDPDDPFTIVYTSGTTGPPKGCVIRHRNYAASVEMATAVPRLFVPGETILLFLPLAHTFARLVELGAARSGVTVAFCPDTTRVLEALAAVRPNVLPSVPRMYERVHATVAQRFADTTGPRRALVEWATRTGYRASALRERGAPVPPALRLRLALADRLVFAKVKERLGGRLRLAISGGAPLAKDVVAFFHAIGIPLLEGYALTETATAGTVNHPDRYRVGTVGLPFPGLPLRVAADGEILIGGESLFAGYLEDEAATRAAFTDDGWLRTGDVGAIDSDGFLTITDRKKDLIVTAAGKNVAPQPLENELRAHPIVAHALVVGDRRPYLVALISIDEEEARRRGYGPDDVKADVGRLVETVNEHRAPPERVRRWAVLPRDFSPEEGEVTPTLKLRRAVCERRFAAEIDALYPRVR